ncbi:THO complex subunit 7 [Spiromyces aspiralis]|uniref:THO complex subunit 7 n=1 Tax=Spiromyces aspiralis TaxID=68401 RepID=A0ACC1HVJ8_9FUNG|nr:THO complex subunit 7 [Spiromyces aspiralis]
MAAMAYSESGGYCPVPRRGLAAHLHVEEVATNAPSVSISRVDPEIRYRIEVEERGLMGLMREYYSMLKQAAHLSPEQSDVASKNVLLKLKMYEQGAREYALIKDKLIYDTNEYKKKTGLLRAGMGDVSEKIVSLRAELQQLRAESRQKIEYDELVHRINQLPSQNKCNEEMKTIREETARLEGDIQNYEQKMAAIRSQFSVGIDALQEVVEMVRQAKELEGLDYIDKAQREDTDRSASAADTPKSTQSVGESASFPENSRPSMAGRKLEPNASESSDHMEIEALPDHRPSATAPMAKSASKEDEEGEVTDPDEISDGEI